VEGVEEGPRRRRGGGRGQGGTAWRASGARISCAVASLTTHGNESGELMRDLSSRKTAVILGYSTQAVIGPAGVEHAAARDDSGLGHIGARH
jgi:hypothetical protein